MSPLLYHVVHFTTGLHHTAVILHILFTATFNTNSVQSFNSSCICAVSIPQHEYSMQTESRRCPLFGVSRIDPVFRMSGGSCPIRVCSDHASSNGHPDADFLVATVKLADLCKSVTSSSLSSAGVEAASGVSSQRCRKPIPKQSRRTGGQSSNRRTKNFL
jgi:hypothetical protein